MLRKLVNAITRPLFIIQKMVTGRSSWELEKNQMQLLSSRRKRKKIRNCSSANFTLSGKVKMQVILEIISKHTTDKRVISSCCYVFVKERSGLTNLIAFYTLRWFARQMREEKFVMAFTPKPCNVRFPEQPTESNFDQWRSHQLFNAKGNTFPLPEPNQKPAKSIAAFFLNLVSLD